MKETGLVRVNFITLIIILNIQWNLFTLVCVHQFVENIASVSVQKLSSRRKLNISIGKNLLSDT